jgi:flagellar biosynthesis chaperone FliJ
MTFYNAVNLYKKNYLDYKLTGLAEFKTAYENAQAWITKYLSQLDKRITEDKEFVSKFVTEYQNTNPELTALQQQMQTIRTEGPKLQDRYETERKMREAAPEDYTSYYVKGGVILATIGIGVIASFF